MANDAGLVFILLAKPRSGSWTLLSVRWASEPVHPAGELPVAEYYQGAQVLVFRAERSTPGSRLTVNRDKEH